MSIYNNLSSRKKINVYYNLPVISSIGFLVPLLYLTYYDKWNIYSDKYNYYFIGLLIICSFISCLFWLDPRKNNNTTLHNFDAFFARLTIVSFIVFKTLFYTSNTPLFLVSTFIMMYFFILSNIYSLKEWCSKAHINTHLCGHVFAVICILLALHTTFSQETENILKD